MLSGWKKNAFLVAYLAAFVIGLGATARYVRADNKDHAKEPQMIVPETRYDFGTITEGQEIRHDFAIENKGQAPLIIQRVRPD